MSDIIQQLISLLKFLRVVDSADGQVSLTSLGLIVVLVKVALIREPSLVDLGALLGVLAMYSHKKMLYTEKRTSDIKLKDLKTDIEASHEKVLLDVKNRLTTVENRTRAPGQPWSPVPGRQG
jgi:hypothetical protein